MTVSDIDRTLLLGLMLVVRTWTAGIARAIRIITEGADVTHSPDAQDDWTKSLERHPLQLTHAAALIGVVLLRRWRRRLANQKKVADPPAASSLAAPSPWAACWVDATGLVR